MTRGPYVGRGMLGILVIMALGAVLAESGAQQGSLPAANADRLDSTAVLSVLQYRNVSAGLRGGELAAVMGGLEVDLRDAAMAGDEIVIEVDVVMGGVELRVPEHWTVVSEMDAVLGGAEFRLARPDDTARARRLILRGAVFMGGLEVRN